MLDGIMLPESIARLRDSRVRIVVFEQPSRFLERMLLASLIVHAIAMLSMVALLVPMLPGGTTPDDLARVAKIAAHPWIYRLGWLPWQATAAADLLLALALLATPWFPRRLAVASFVLVLCAIFFDQSAQVMLTAYGPALARTSPHAFLAFEQLWFPYTAAWAACLYTATAIVWSIGFARAKTWSKMLTRLSAVAWTVFAASSVAMLLPARLRPPQIAVSCGNAIGFVLFEIWSVAVLDRVLARSRPEEDHGRMAPWTSGVPVLGRILDAVAGSRTLRWIAEAFPFLALESDIHDVVYVNYLVEAERLERYVPRGLILDRVGPTGRFAIFTHLTYRHGHLGPRILGPLRRLAGSPVQSNWRIHVRDPRTGVHGIYFVTSAIGSIFYALVGRLLGEGMPMHVARGAIVRSKDGGIRVTLAPGRGSAPDLDASFTPSTKRELEGAWLDAFEDYDEMLAYVVPQDRAMSTQPWHRRVTRQELQLGIPLDACEPLVGDVRSNAAQKIARDAPRLAFRVASVSFKLEHEEHDPIEE